MIDVVLIVYYANIAVWIYIYKIFVDPNCEKSWSFEFGEFECLEKKEFFDWEFFESLWNLIFLRYLNKGKCR